MKKLRPMTKGEMEIAGKLDEFFEREETPIGAVCTLADLKVWVDEKEPDQIIIPPDHSLTHIREFNKNYEFHWKTFNGIPIKYL